LKMEKVSDDDDDDDDDDVERNVREENARQ
jgi:hypothetical protein